MHFLTVLEKERDKEKSKRKSERKSLSRIEVKNSSSEELLFTPPPEIEETDGVDEVRPDRIEKGGRDQEPEKERDHRSHLLRDSKDGEGRERGVSTPTKLRRNSSGRTSKRASMKLPRASSGSSSPSSDVVSGRRKSTHLSPLASPTASPAASALTHFFSHNVSGSSSGDTGHDFSSSGGQHSPDLASHHPTKRYDFFFSIFFSIFFFVIFFFRLFSPVSSHNKSGSPSPRKPKDKFIELHHNKNYGVPPPLAIPPGIVA